MTKLWVRCYDVAFWFSYHFLNSYPVSLSLCAADLGISVQYVSFIISSSEFSSRFPKLQARIYQDIYERRCSICSYMRLNKQRKKEV